MKTPIRELPRIELPRSLVHVTSITCGVLAAIAVQILLGRAGIELADTWHTVMSTQALLLRSAGPWWLIIGSAFLASAIVAAALSRLPLPWNRFRTVRWVIAAVIVYALTEVGHMASAAVSHSADGAHNGGTHAAATLATLGAAALVALFGSYFAFKR